MERRHRERAERRTRGVVGRRRYRLGPSSGGDFYSPGMLGTSYRSRAAADTTLDHEVDLIAAALGSKGPTDRRMLARLVGARRWGPGRFAGALGEAVAEGRIVRTRRGTYAPAEGSSTQRG